MIYVTEQAKQELKRLLSTNEDIPEAHLRIMDRGLGELGLDTDIMKPDDQVVKYEGKVLLIAEPGLTSNLKIISLDAYKTFDGPRLVITEEVVNQSSKTVTVNWISLPQSSRRQS